KVRDCNHAEPGLMVGSRMLPVVSLTGIVQLAWKTQFTAGALTSTTFSTCARAADGKKQTQKTAHAASTPTSVLLRIALAPLAVPRRPKPGLCAHGNFDARLFGRFRAECSRFRSSPIARPP